MNRVSAPSYDLFKLLVTLVLIVILTLMLLRGCATTAASPLPTENSSVSEPVQNSGSPASPELIAATDTVEADIPSPTPSAIPATPTQTTVQDTPTPEAAATEPAATAQTPTPTTADSSSCNTSVASRLSVGQEARVVQRLNMRSDASITAPILQTNSINTRVEVIGGPVCTPVGERAYLWWQIRLPGGAEGWSVESQLNEPSYLLEPIP